MPYIYNRRLTRRSASSLCFQVSRPSKSSLKGGVSNHSTPVFHHQQMSFKFARPLRKLHFVNQSHRTNRLNETIPPACKLHPKNQHVAGADGVADIHGGVEQGRAAVTGSELIFAGDLLFGLCDPQI